MGATPEVAGLILRLYEMRRDHELRKAREWFDTAFDPQSAQDVIGLVGSGFAQSAYFRMVLTYWEMVAALVNAGAIDAGLIHATNVEHLRYWAKLEPFMTGFVENNNYLGRPVDFLMLKDGSLLVSDDHAGAIYRISYSGGK